jgi:uncharacterized ion transporter superfamily protein YfcC
MWLNLLGLGIMYKNKQETKMLMSNAEKAHAEKMARGEIDYAQLIKSDQQNSWKDEFVLILISLPILLLVWSIFSNDPDIKVKLDLFFQYFNELPMWFQILFVSVIGAIYGIKGTELIKRK